MAKRRFLSSDSVRNGPEIRMPGTTTPLPSVRTPPAMTRHLTSVPSVSSTLSCMAPSSSSTRSPAFTSRARSGRLTGTNPFFPVTCRLVNTTCDRFLSSSWPPSIKFAGPVFGPGQVHEDGDICVQLLAHLPDRPNIPAVFAACAMRQVQPGNVHSGKDKAFCCRCRARCRTDGGDYLGAPFYQSGSYADTLNIIFLLSLLHERRRRRHR